MKTLILIALILPGRINYCPDALWTAICEQESGGDPLAYNADEDAAGIAQIRMIYLRDANRIVGEDRFTSEDRWSPEKSREMFEIVTSYYIRHYRLEDNPENRARIHNGGASGWRRNSTLKYWKEVNRRMVKMIEARKATRESRKRDSRRKRIILKIGDRSIHISREEAKSLLRDLKKIYQN